VHWQLYEAALAELVEECKDVLEIGNEEIERGGRRPRHRICSPVPLRRSQRLVRPLPAAIGLMVLCEAGRDSLDVDVDYDLCRPDGRLRRRQGHL
jgi:hypothetical protein